MKLALLCNVALTSLAPYYKCVNLLLTIFPVTMLSSCAVKFVLPVSCAICVPVDWRDLQLQINIHRTM